MMKALLRTTYRWGYRVAPFVWRCTRPKTEGAMLAIRRGDRVLFVRNSYRPEWSLPGGGLKPGERPVEAAAREAREEVGWRVEPGEIERIGVVTCVWRHRTDTVTLFGFRAARDQPIEIDDVEVVEARWIGQDAAAALFLQPHVRHFLAEIYA